MKERTYIIAFDALNAAFEPLAVRRAIKSSDAFPNWWNHMPTVFLVKTEMTAEAVSDFVRPAANGTRFLVMEVDPTNSNGWLPDRSWQWIRSREDELAHGGE